MTLSTAHISARFDPSRRALLDELTPLRYEHRPRGLPAHVRAASAVRRFDNRLVIVQDDVNALAVRGDDDAIRAVLLPPSASGELVFDDTRGNKREKLDLEAGVTLPNGTLVAFGSGSLPARERLVVWRRGKRPAVVAATAFYGGLRAAVTGGATRLNIEGAVVRGGRLELLHRGNDVRASSTNAIAAVDCGAFARWLEGGEEAPCVASVTTVDLGTERGVPYGFTDAVAIDDERVVVLACAEDSEDALVDGPVLGCRVGTLADGALTMVDVYGASGARSLLKIEGIEQRPPSRTQFDVAVDVDRPSAPALLGRLVWDWS